MTFAVSHDDRIGGLQPADYLSLTVGCGRGVDLQGRILRIESRDAELIALLPVEQGFRLSIAGQLLVGDPLRTALRVALLLRRQVTAVRRLLCLGFGRLGLRLLGDRLRLGLAPESPGPVRLSR